MYYTKLFLPLQGEVPEGRRGLCRDRLERNLRAPFRHRPAGAARCHLPLKGRKKGTSLLFPPRKGEVGSQAQRSEDGGVTETKKPGDSPTI